MAVIGPQCDCYDTAVFGHVMCTQRALSARRKAQVKAAKERLRAALEWHTRSPEMACLRADYDR